MDIRNIKKVMLDYVSGNDITDYSMDSLENDPMFMLEVIKFSRDKKLYNYCTDNVKKNYEFVKFLVTTFCDDFPFISMVASTYLEDSDYSSDKGIIDDVINDNEDIASKELIVLMSNYEKKYSDVSIYSVQAEMVGLSNDIILEKISTHDDGDKITSFQYIEATYGTSDILKEFFAKRLLNKIFYHRGFNGLQLDLHKRFKTVDELNKKGVINYIVDRLFETDSFLARYVSVHNEVADFIKKDVLLAIKNWDNYQNKYDNLRADRFMKYVDSLLKDVPFEDEAEYNNEVRRAIFELGLGDLFGISKFDVVDDIDYASLYGKKFAYEMNKFILKVNLALKKMFMSDIDFCSLRDGSASTSNVVPFKSRK